MTTIGGEIARGARGEKVGARRGSGERELQLAGAIALRDHAMVHPRGSVERELQLAGEPIDLGDHAVARRPTE